MGRGKGGGEERKKENGEKEREGKKREKDRWQPLIHVSTRLSATVSRLIVASNAGFGV